MKKNNALGEKTGAESVGSSAMVSWLDAERAFDRLRERSSNLTVSELAEYHAKAKRLWKSIKRKQASDQDQARAGQRAATQKAL